MVVRVNVIKLKIVNFFINDTIMPIYIYARYATYDSLLSNTINYIKYWFKNNELHSDCDLPAIEFANSKYWYKNDKRHRDNDLPAIEFYNGNKWWFKNGKLHRDNDLPAIERDGYKSWYKNNKDYYPFIYSMTINTIMKNKIMKMGDKWWYANRFYDN